MNLQELLPIFPPGSLMNLIMESQWQVCRGSIDRFPEFLRPDGGALSSIAKLGNWSRFHVAFRDDAGRYHQVRGTGDSAWAYYNKGALVTSRCVEELSAAAKDWLGAWATHLGVSRNALRLNSWAAKGTSGVDWHFDHEDVIHFQIKGDKLFRFLRVPITRFADKQTKKFEKTLAAQLNFSEASEEVVSEGTITIIPRGVWHWTEGKSEESFAVSLCIDPATYAEALTQTLFKRLRLIERYRAPVFGSTVSQREALDRCASDAGAFLRAMDSKSVVSQECQLELPLENVGEFYFYIGKRAQARLKPLRMLVDGQELVIQEDEQKRGVLEAVCEMGHGFRTIDLHKRVLGANENEVNEILALLVRIGFLDFLDANLDSSRNLTLSTHLIREDDDPVGPV